MNNNSDFVPADQDADEAAEIAKRDPERGDADGPFGHEPEQPPQSVDDLMDEAGIPNDDTLPS